MSEVKPACRKLTQKAFQKKNLGLMDIISEGNLWILPQILFLENYITPLLFTRNEKKGNDAPRRSTLASSHRDVAPAIFPMWTSCYYQAVLSDTTHYDLS